MTLKQINARLTTLPKDYEKALRLGLSRGRADAFRAALRGMARESGRSTREIRSHRRVFSRVTPDNNIRVWLGLNPLPARRRRQEAAAFPGGAGDRILARAADAAIRAVERTIAEVG